MGVVLDYRRRHARASAGSRSLSGESGPVQSSASTAPPVKALIVSIASQSGRTKRRRYRLTLTRDLPMPAATSSSESLREAMKSERCMAENVHPTHNKGQGPCTPGVVYGLGVPVHHAYMAQAKVVPRLKPDPRYGETQIRAWRKHRGLTLEQLAERIGMTHATLSRIERGKQPYNQVLLESLAEALQTDVASLLIRDPADPDGIWSIWEQASRGQRRQLVDIAKTLLRAS